MCGSADFNLGKFAARDAREAVATHLKLWSGDVLVLDGFLSDELTYFPLFDQAINDAVTRAPRLGDRLEADDPEHAEIAVSYLKHKSIPLDTQIFLTGAWYDSTEEYGCVNATRDALLDAGYTCVTVAESCGEM